MRKTLRIFRNWLRIFPIFFPILLFISFHFILDNYVIFHKKGACSRGISEVSGVGGPLRWGSFQIWEFGSWLLVWVKYLGMWKLRKSVQFIFFLENRKKKSDGFSKMRKRSRIFRNQLQIFRNLFLILLFMLT